MVPFDPRDKPMEVMTFNLRGNNQQLVQFLLEAKLQECVGSYDREQTSYGDCESPNCILKKE